MSFLVCPLCGKSSSLRHFDPSGFDIDIYAQDVVGLGKGRGFRVTGRHSIVKSATAVLIKDRLLDLLVLLYKHGVLEHSEISKQFELLEKEELHACYARLEEQTKRKNRLSDELRAALALKEESGEKLRVLKGRLDYESNKRQEMIDGLTAILDDIEDRLGPDWRSYSDDPVDELRSIIERLIDEYRAALAKGEEDSVE